MPGAVLIASVALATGLSILPPVARVAAAATGQLLIAAAATYTLDPETESVHVAVETTLTNDKPSDSEYRYFWRELSWSVQPEATDIHVSDGDGTLGVTPVAMDGYIDARFRLRRDLLYGQSVSLTIAWDLPGGSPRSDSTVRVGRAFAAFDLWAWGDGAGSSVTATLPAGFEVETSGSRVVTTTGPDGVTVTARDIADPAGFWTSVSAVRDDALTEDELTLEGGVELVVRAWPEDRVWRMTVSSTLRRGLPRLQDLIGLDWPVERRLEVIEVYAPLLEGYAGRFDTAEQRIEISEHLDEVTILHEGAHAWFNDALFAGRWIGEGLAETYATAVLGELTGARPDPDRPRASDDGGVDLDAWTFPGRVTDETDASETYGYNASWYVVDELFDEIGAERMREVLAAAAGDTIAYVGSPSPEIVAGSDTWRRFLDLLVEIGESQLAEDLFRDYVTGPTGDRELDARADVRADYERLIAAGDDWLPPVYVRGPMGAWNFDRAADRIEEAAAILELRDAVVDAAEELELEPDDAFERAYETATDDLDRAAALGAAHVEALEALAAARIALDAEADLVTAIGLLGSTVAAEYDAAAAAFEEGDLDEAAEAAAAASAIVAAASRLGGERVVGTIAASAFLLAVALFLRRRRKARRPAFTASQVPAGHAFEHTASGPMATPAPASDAELVPTDLPSAAGPCGTLAADPPAEPSHTDVGSGPEGGFGDGDGSDAGR